MQNSNQQHMQSGNGYNTQQPRPRSNGFTEQQINQSNHRPQQEQRFQQQPQNNNNSVNSSGYNHHQRPNNPQENASGQPQNIQANRNDRQNGFPKNNTSNNQADSDPRKFQNIKSHGGKAAFEVAPDETMKGWHTIRLEGAPAKGDGTKAFNWDEKVSIQITKTELPIVIGVLLGYLPMCEFKNHGGDAAKWFYMENQGKNFFFKIGQGTPKRMSVCPIPTVEAYLMGTLALTQHVKNFEGLDSNAALASLKTMCAHLMKSGQHAVKPNSQCSQRQ